MQSKLTQLSEITEKLPLAEKSAFFCQWSEFTAHLAAGAPS